jgi:hypothetical protein
VAFSLVECYFGDCISSVLCLSDFRLIVEELLLLPFKRMLEDKGHIRMALIL